MKKSLFLLAVLAVCATADKSSSTISFFGKLQGTEIRSVIKPYVPIGAGNGYLQGQTEQFKSDCALYGFNVDTHWFPYNGNTFVLRSFTRYDADKLQYQTDIQQVLLQSYNDLDAFCVAYRIVTSPVATRNWGFMGIGSHSDTWYTREVKTTATLNSNYSIVQWAPKNQHENYNGSIGISAGTSGFAVSASVNYSYNQLQLTSRTNVATGTYETDYYISGENSYNRYSSEYYGMFTFKRNNKGVYPLKTLTHEVSYYGYEWFKLEKNTYTISLY